VEWCSRRLLARIHSYTLNRLRKEIEPVSAADFMRFLFVWQKVAPDHRVEGPESLASIIDQLEGFEAHAGSWESEILPARVADYDPAWLDSLTRLVARLRGTGAKILVLGPIPDPHSTVPACLSDHVDDPASCSQPRDVAVNDTGIRAEAAATATGGGRYDDVTNLFCTASRCPMIVGEDRFAFAEVTI